ncbi:MAG TPA: CNNM domain-containing protein, partial [Chloroflexota bacterium]
MSDPRIPIFAVSLLLAFLAAAAQASLVYIDRARLRHMLDEGTPRARALARLLDEPTSTLSTILVVYTLALSAAAASAYWLDLEVMDAFGPWLSAALIVGELLLLLLAQFLGRIVALARPERVALAFVRPVELLIRVLFVVLVPLNALDVWARGLLGVQHGLTPADAEDRLRHLVEGNTDLEEDEREMIASVIELGEQPVREIMVPRIDIVAAPESSTVRDVLDRIVTSGHSRIPIYDGSIDNVTGVVYAKDLLKFMRDGSQSSPVQGLAREPSYVPETKKVDELLHEMQEKNVHMVVVVDEYDVSEEEPLTLISDREALVDARYPMDELNDKLNLGIEESEEYD